MTLRAAVRLGAAGVAVVLAGFAPAGRARAESLRDRFERVTAYGDSLEPMDNAERAEVLALVRPVLAEARAANDSTILVSLLPYEGSLLHGLGKTREAEAPLVEALAFAEARNDTARLCNAHRHLSFVTDLLGRPDEAQHHLLALRTLAGSAGLEDQAIWAQLGLARAAMRRGESAAAKAEVERALRDIRRLARAKDEVAALNLLGLCLKNLGDMNGALREWNFGLDRAGAIGDARMANHLRSNLAALEYYIGDPGSALARHEELFAEAWRDGQLELALDLGANIVTEETLLGRFRDAESMVERVLPVARREGWVGRERKILNVLGMLRLEQGLDSLAARAFRESIALPGGDRVDDEVEAVTGLAQVLGSQGREAEALALVEERAAFLRARLSSEVALTFDRVLGERLFAAGRARDALELMRRLDRESAAIGVGHHRAFALATAGRCHRLLGAPDSALACLRAAAEVWESQREAPLDPDWRAQRGADANAIATELASAVLERDSLDVAEAFVSLQRFKARTLDERMRGPGSTGEGFEPASLAELQTNVLREGDLFLDLTLGPARSIALAVTPREARAVWLPPSAEIEIRARFLHDVLAAAGAPRGRHRAARELGDLVLGGLADLVRDATRLVVSPDGALNAIPIEALVLASPGDPSREIVLADKVTFVVPSASLLGAIRRRGITDTGRVLALCGAFGGSGAPLGGAREEVRGLARSLRHVRVVEPADLASAPSLQLAGFDVLHLAAHAWVDDEHPWRSGFAFAANPEKSDGSTLRASDVASLKLGATLAVLSGCESAGGRVLSGEGVQGLSSAFLAAGCHAVVATLWPVDDRTTARLMRRFYRALAAGSSASAALHEAKRELREDPKTEDPAHWAGFVLVGDGDARVPLQRRFAPAGAALAAAAILALLAGLFARRR